jgi:hypothetical protein
MTQWSYNDAISTKTQVQRITRINELKAHEEVIDCYVDRWEKSVGWFKIRPSQPTRHSLNDDIRCTYVAPNR